MRKWQKVLGVVFLVIWVGGAIEKAFKSNPRVIEIYEETNPDAKIKYLSSDLSFFDVRFTIDHEWAAIWNWDDGRKVARWSRKYNKPIPLGIYFGMGTS